MSPHRLLRRQAHGVAREKQSAWHLQYASIQTLTQLSYRISVQKDTPGA